MIWRLAEQPPQLNVERKLPQSEVRKGRNGVWGLPTGGGELQLVMKTGKHGEPTWGKRILITSILKTSGAKFCEIVSSAGLGAWSCKSQLTYHWASGKANASGNHLGSLSP